MEELFGLSMNGIMLFLLATFIGGLAVVVLLAVRNRVMAKLGLRNIPRRWAQTILIIVGVMLSTVIMSAALGTGDTISFSIRSETLKGLGHIDEILVYSRAGAEDSLGSSSYVPFERFEQIERDLAGLDTIDGLTAQLAETAPTVDLRTSLSEGQMRVVGIDPARMEGFGAFTLTSGGEVRLESLAPGEAYLNDRAAKELDAEAGDDLRVVIGEESHILKVRGVVERGGLAGFGSTLILPLEPAQALFDRASRVNLIVVSNRGDEVAGERLSEEVTRELRVLFADREVASQLKELLNQEPVLTALERRQSVLEGDLKRDLSSLRTELERDELSDELISLLADEDVSDELLDILNIRGDLPVEEGSSSARLEALREAGLEASTLFRDLREFQVFDFKHDALSIADDAGSATTSLFLIMSLFSIMVGVLLIFLIFVMLAAARRSEMGMTRAVGAKRSHLVKMFLFEGTAYALVSAAVGVVLGLLVSALIVLVINRIIATFDADFRIVTHFTVRSAIVAYCLGMVITFGTILFSAYRVSRLNIVMAIRGLPETLLPSEEPPFRTRLNYLRKAQFRPVLFLIRGVRFAVRRRFGRLVQSWLFAVLWVVIFPIWIVDIVVGVFRFAWPYLLRGWLTFLLGLLVAVGVASGSIPERDSLFGGGVSLMILGLGLMLRTALKRTSLRPEVRDRIAFTAIGVGILVMWALPPDTFRGITGDLDGDFDVMFIAGIFMVASAVWAVMFNADLLLKALTAATGRVG
ncbi:MAG: FtsX-like permease family protein, partial [Chloroflexi bacterium]|nr:FtsX-like permease family protein [Chloroflexota bacterium]